MCVLARACVCAWVSIRSSACCASVPIHTCCRTATNVAPEDPKPSTSVPCKECLPIDVYLDRSKYVPVLNPPKQNGRGVSISRSLMTASPSRTVLGNLRLIALV